MPITELAQPAPAEFDTPRAPRTGVLVAVGSLGLLLPVLLVWMRLPHLLYAGLDGSLYRFTIAQFLRDAPPFSLNAMDMFQGLGSPLIPMNVWLDPGYLVFGVLNGAAARILSAAIFLSAYCFSTFLLARTIGLSLVAAIIAGQLAVIAFPPFQYETGLGLQFILNPGAAYPLALITIILCLVLRISTFSLQKVALRGLGIAALYAYSVYCDPLWTPVVSLAFVVPFLVFMLADSPRSALLARLASLAIAAFVLYVIGTFDYVFALVEYTARVFFQREVSGEVQVGSFVSILFQSRAAILTYWLWLSGWVLAAIFTTGKQRLLAVMCFVYVLFLTGLSVVYLFTDINWNYPVPMYFEQSVYHLFTLAAVAGWAALLRQYGAILRRMPFPAELQDRFGRISPVFEAVCVLSIPATLIYYLIATVPMRQGLYVEKAPPETGFLGQLGKAVGVQAARPFRGSVTIPVIPKQIAVGTKKERIALDSYQTKRMRYTLWSHGIPTLEDYGQTVTPPVYFLVSRLLTGSHDPIGRNGIFVSVLNLPALEVLGVRFLLTPETIKSPDAVLRGSHGTGSDPLWNLYELKTPNIGDYSPTQIRIARSGSSSLEMMRSPGFDFRKDVILTHPIAQPLSPARDTGFSFDRGVIHVWGKSNGTSLLVLPLQYSNCLKTEADSNSATITRADLALAGIVFERKLDVRIRWEFGIFSRQCRWRDLQDLKDLRIKAGENRTLLAQHPYALIALKDLRRKLYALLSEMP